MTTYQQLTTFIRSTFYEPEAFIPLHDPRFIGNEKKYLMECIDSNFVSSVGKFVGQMEQMCAEYTGAKIPHAWEFRHDIIGYNYRMTNIQAALGCAQMEQLVYLLRLKRELAMQYKEFFANTEFEFITEPENCQSNYWLNAIITKDCTQRDELLEYTNAHGVMTRPIWELMSRLSMFAHCQTDSLENSIWLADRVMNIPSGAPIEGYGK
ncbi:MAG: DegT/DnrJ/EryC1/StrS family aminotransferase [Prolixibacteraceae bacterium]|nr:DegT/DnrJ/EryC1/StrS family aminotransferase [Prolixibacteraceae bacterium]